MVSGNPAASAGAEEVVSLVLAAGAAQAAVARSARPAAAAMQSLRDAYSGPEKMELRGTELYIEYGSGMGQSKLTNALIERKLGVTGTARNWNTVTKLLEIAEALR